MKLASFHADGRDRIGFAIDDATIGDLAAVLTRAGLSGELEPRTLLELIEAGPDVLAAVAAALNAGISDVQSFACEAVEWHAPVRKPSKICCIALNNSANADRIMSGPKHPAMFVKPASALVGHGDAIICKPSYGRTHPEPELALVIGKRAKDVDPERAYDYVFGYTVHNDITSPTMRGEDTFHYRAIHPVEGDPSATQYVDTWVSYPGRYKCADTFACMGPWLVTKDEIPAPHDLAVTCLHKGREITSDNTGNLFYKIPEVIAFLSSYMTFLPGDIISMGTALNKSARGGAVQNIDLNKLGGPITVTIDRVGSLTNSVRNEA
jgi:2-keto-4-pentenoate hydratase/2-oxohepta-3-ene-1,7-dioic acid hydratase in catechol pathway